MSSEPDCKYVSSRGILKSCAVISSLPTSSIRTLVGYDFSRLKAGDLVYICNSAIPAFVRDVFPSLKVPFRLVSGDCDESCPTELFHNAEEFLQFIDDSRILVWYAQNCVHVTHPKLRQLPIGQDYHTMSGQSGWGPPANPLNQEQLLDAIKEKALPLDERKCMAYSNFHFSMQTKYAFDRREAIDKVPKDLVFYEPERCWRMKTWKNQSEYAFVVSPHGNGLDCHRTWEALCLGCIPIMKTSPLDPLFEGLPVLIVKDWSDVTRELLETTQREYASREFQKEKLLLSYWIDRINDSSPSGETNV